MIAALYVETDGGYMGLPGPNRWKERSRTFEGIAEAMGAQWGNYTDLVTQMEAA